MDEDSKKVEETVKEISEKDLETSISSELADAKKKKKARKTRKGWY